MKTQLFCTEKEMNEIFNESQNLVLFNFQITEDGVLAFYEEKHLQFPKSVNYAKKKDTVIYTYVNGSYMYVSKLGGTTFLLSEALNLTREKAIIKASCMSKKGNYIWKTKKI